jgi:ABC-2 type transport system ATP-binding protein
VAFLVEGKIRHIDKTENLLNEAQQDKIIEFLTDKDCLKNEDILLEKLSNYEIELTESKIRIHVDERTEIKKFIDLFHDLNCNVYEARFLRPSLEDIFVKITGLDIEEMKNNKKKGGK